MGLGRGGGQASNGPAGPCWLSSEWPLSVGARIATFGYSLEQRSPTFLAPRTDFLKDNFSTDWGGRQGRQEAELRPRRGRETGRGAQAMAMVSTGGEWGGWGPLV